MSEPAWFEDWFNSSYYHQLYFQRDDQEAADFIERLLAFLKPAADSRMLDVACGKGRHSRMLAAAGFDVTGIDLASASIAEANTYAHEHLRFYEHDMRLPFHIRYYQYAFNFFTSFGYFKTEREHANALRSIAQSLVSGGILVIDYLNVHYSEDHLIHKMEKEIGQVNYYITKWFDETHFYKKIVVEDDALEQPLTYTEKVAKFSLGDFNDMLSYHGMQIQTIFGDYQLGAYDVKKSPRMIIIAQKTN